MSGKSTWRHLFDTVESAAAALLEEFTHSPDFAYLTRCVIEVHNGASTWSDRRSRQMWHLLNLPAASDISRLSRQVASLDHEVRVLRGELGRLPGTGAPPLAAPQVATGEPDDDHVAADSIRDIGQGRSDAKRQGRRRG